MRAAVPIVLFGTLAGCRYTTEPADMPVTGNWLGHIPRLDGGLAWEFRLHEDGLGNVSGTVSRTDFVRIPAPSETVSPGTVEGVHASSEVRLILDYGSHSEAYEGRFRSDDRIEGFIVRGTVVRNIGTLELRRIARSSDDTADGATIPANGGIMPGNSTRHRATHTARVTRMDGSTVPIGRF